MDNALQIAKDYATLINSVLLIVLLFKYASDIRKQRLEYEKLERELKALREREAKATQRVLFATPDDLKRYVIDPMIESIRRREEEPQSRQHLLEDLYEASYFIRDLPERSSFGRDLSALIEQNTSAIQRLTETLNQIEKRELGRSMAQQTAAPDADKPHR